MTELLASIQKRCELHELQFKHVTFNLEDIELGLPTTPVEGLVIQIPEGRDHKNLIFLDDEELQQAARSQFEIYRFIKGYEAIWSEQLRVIECEIQSDTPLRMSSLVFRRLGRLLGQGQDEPDSTSYSLPSPHPSVTITIGEASVDFTTMSSFKRDTLFGRISRVAKRTTVRIEGLNIHSHGDALDALHKLGGSALFQIDLTTNLPIQFVIDRDLTRELKAGRRRMLKQGSSLGPPKYQYDQESLSLYWYARTAQNMPLLQFLAYYQVLEFYFPTYSQAEAQHRIRNLLKSPTFDPNSDTDIAHLLNTIKVSAKGRAFGDERTQLKATISSCVDNQSLWDYFSSSQERLEFFDIQKKSKSLAKQKLPLSNPEADLRSDVSNRIYELRCRIVHTKEEDDFELILPFSPEVGYIKFDLDLIEMIARKVIIASSRPLQLSV